MRLTAKNFVVAVHVSEGRRVLAVCDSNIHGKKFEDKKASVDLGSKFYTGSTKTAEETEKLMKSAYIINAVGNEAVAMVVRLGLAGKDDAKTLVGVRHIQVLML